MTMQIHPFDFKTLQSGAKVAVCGPSGSGKTAIVKQIVEAVGLPAIALMPKNPGQDAYNFLQVQIMDNLGALYTLPESHTIVLTEWIWSMGEGMVNIRDAVMALCQAATYRKQIIILEAQYVDQIPHRIMTQQVGTYLMARPWSRDQSKSMWEKYYGSFSTFNDFYAFSQSSESWPVGTFLGYSRETGILGWAGRGPMKAARCAKKQLLIDKLNEATLLLNDIKQQIDEL